MDTDQSRVTASVLQQYRMFHNVYVLLDDGDRRVLQPFGLTIPQYRVLQTLDTRQGVRLTTVSERLLRAKSTITRIIDQLEQDGLVERTSDADDRRAQRVILTGEGKKLLERARAAHEALLVARFNDALEEGEQAAFYQLLVKLHDSLVETMDWV